MNQTKLKYELSYINFFLKVFIILLFFLLKKKVLHFFIKYPNIWNLFDKNNYNFTNFLQLDIMSAISPE